MSGAKVAIPDDAPAGSWVFVGGRGQVEIGSHFATYYDKGQDCKCNDNTWLVDYAEILQDALGDSLNNVFDSRLDIMGLAERAKDEFDSDFKALEYSKLCAYGSLGDEYGIVKRFKCKCCSTMFGFYVCVDSIYVNCDPANCGTWSVIAWGDEGSSSVQTVQMQDDMEKAISSKDRKSTYGETCTNTQSGLCDSSELYFPCCVGSNICKTPEWYEKYCLMNVREVLEWPPPWFGQALNRFLKWRAYEGYHYDDYEPEEIKSYWQSGQYMYSTYEDWLNSKEYYRDGNRNQYGLETFTHKYFELELETSGQGNPR